MTFPVPPATPSIVPPAVLTVILFVFAAPDSSLTIHVCPAFPAAAAGSVATNALDVAV